MTPPTPTTDSDRDAARATLAAMIPHDRIVRTRAFTALLRAAVAKQTGGDRR